MTPADELHPRRAVDVADEGSVPAADESADRGPAEGDPAQGRRGNGSRRGGEARRNPAGPMLHEVGGRPPLGVYITRLLARRHFAWTHASAQALSKNSSNVLGNIWLVLGPMLDAFAYYVIFALILKTDRGMPNFFAFIVLGVFLFRYSMKSLNAGSGLIRSSKGLIRGFAFPRAALPLAALIREAISMVPVIITALVLVVAVPPHEPPNRLWILLPALLALQTVFNFGLILTTARLTYHLPDLSSLISVLSRFWMYGSGVLFSVERFVDSPGFMTFMKINPLFHILAIARSIVIDETVPPAEPWLILTAWSAGMLLFGFIYFWRGEVNYGRE